MTDSDVISGSEAGYRAFLLAFRQRIGRPMSGLEETLAHLAYAAGFTDGADWAYRDVEANMPDETEAR
jgi:hypothetical protein